MKPVSVIRGDGVTLRYQLKEDGAAKDITGMSFKLGVKEAKESAAHKIGPIDGVINDAASGKFSFTLTSAHTDQAPFAGVMEVAMYDAGGPRSTLTKPGGVAFTIVEDILDE